MNKSKNKRKIILTTFIGLIIIPIIALILVFTNTTGVSAASSAGEKYDSQLLPFVRIPTIEEKFRDNKVEVILRHDFSQITEISLDAFNQGNITF